MISLSHIVVVQRVFAITAGCDRACTCVSSSALAADAVSDSLTYQPLPQQQNLSLLVHSLLQTRYRCYNDEMFLVLCF